MLKNIEITNYRNIINFKDSISETSNLIIAPNSTGKTNFLESIYYSALGNSFKPVQHIGEFIGPGKEFSRVQTTWDNDQLELVVSQVKNTFFRKFSIDQKKIPISKVIGRYPVLIFAPNSVDLVCGEPSIRRNDLDNYLSMIDKIYKQQIERYYKVLKNRNALIKQIREGRSNKNELDYWTTELISTAKIIYLKRRDFFDSIALAIKSTVEQIEIFLKDNYYWELELNYIPNIDVATEDFENALSIKFNEGISKEIAAGKTLYGIHKDDYRLLHSGKDLRFFGSRGQQRLATFLIKVSQLTYYYSKFNAYPIFLIDDLMSELDNINRKKIAKYLASEKFQFILTSAEKMEVPDELYNTSKILLLTSE